MSYLHLHFHEFVNEEVRTSKQLRKQYVQHGIVLRATATRLAGEKTWQRKKRLLTNRAELPSRLWSRPAAPRIPIAILSNRRLLARRQVETNLLRESRVMRRRTSP